jgi:glutaminyl-tRNA synthetase
MFENAKLMLDRGRHRIGALPSAFDEVNKNYWPTIASADHILPGEFRVFPIEQLPSSVTWPFLEGIRDLRASIKDAVSELIVIDGGPQNPSIDLPVAHDQREYAEKCKRLDTPRGETKSFLLSLAAFKGGVGQEIYGLYCLDRAVMEHSVKLSIEITNLSILWLSSDSFTSDRERVSFLNIYFDEIEPFAFQPVVPTLEYLADATGKLLNRFETFVTRRRTKPPKKLNESESQKQGLPGQDFIRDIVRADLQAGRYKEIVTRFPPEPNGYLHIGHAKSIALNFGVAKEFDGHCNLRYDDTNPTKESQEYIDAIERDVRWLGFDWGKHLYHASDYFERLYGWAEVLIRAGKAYVDDQSQDEVRATRGTLTEPGKNSPFRDRSIEENLERFHRMRAGEFPDGACVLRAKIDMASGNINLRDPVLYRIMHAEHPRTGTKWKIYPSYDFAHGQSDAIEGITHSLCTLEFEDHRPLYDWFLENLPVPSRPHQYEFARLNLSYTILSKRVLTELVRNGYVRGWDDPRMPTLAGLRRRGVPPQAIRDFVKQIGVAKAHSVVDVAMLEFSIREHLNQTAERRMAVLRPLKVLIENYQRKDGEEVDAINNPANPATGTRSIRFRREIYIEREDFMEEPTQDFFRLAPGREVRLRYAYSITCQKVIKNEEGEVIELRCTYDPFSRGGTASDGRKGQATLHWVSMEDSIPAEVRLYNPLFTKPDPSATDFAADINPNSLEVIGDARVEPALAARNADDAVQFERLGYFCPDKDSTPERLVFNRTVGLRDTWAKVSGGG